LTTLKSPTLDEDTSSEPVPNPERQEKAKKYARSRRYLTFAEMAITITILLLLVFGGLSKMLAGALPLPLVPAAVLYIIILMAAYRLLSAPLSYYGGFVLPQRYGLSHQEFTGWLSDTIKAGALALALGVGIVAVGYWFITIQPQLWWLLAWGFILLLSFILSFLAPVVIVPIFFKMKPLADTELKERLEKLAERAKIKVGGIYIVEFSSKATTANAALMGMGKTRRIALSDTLLDKYSAEEIEVIIAHEMGHHKNRDFIRLFLWQASILFISFLLTHIIARAVVTPLGFNGIDDIAALPLLALVLALLSLLLMPVSNTYTRSRERAADNFSLRLTGQPQAFITMMTKLTDQNLAEAEPSRWVERLFHDHPSYKTRLEHARCYSSKQKAWQTEVDSLYYRFLRGKNW
jgi:STE24 endopeptidase